MTTPASLPSLNALRAFEAAARRLSFKGAAAELHVTPAAIGHQIKALEEHFGAPLFRRLNRRLLLTDAGQACLPHLRSGFDMLGKAVDVLRKEPTSNVLTVTVEPGTSLVVRFSQWQTGFSATALSANSVAGPNDQSIV